MDRKVARERRDVVPIVVDDRDRIVWVAGHAINEDFRVTDPAQAVIILRLKGVGRLGLNSTLKSLLFWMVLVVVGVLIWNFSTKYQTRDHQLTFSEFMAAVDAGNVSSVVITGQEITGSTKDNPNQTFRTYVAEPVRRSGERSLQEGRPDSVEGADGEPVGLAASITGRRSW